MQLLSYRYTQVAQNFMIFMTLFHFLSYFLLEVAIFYVLVKTGSGLQLVPHKLKNNWMQFEGYDSQGKHLFTFTLNQYGKAQATAVRFSPSRERSGSLGGSDFTGDDEHSRLDQTVHGESIVENIMSDKLTEYEVTEKLLNLKRQLRSVSAHRLS